jgi:lipoprotein-anchoring transpeptidase ErfK/SrfK
VAESGGSTDRRQRSAQRWWRWALLTAVVLVPYATVTFSPPAHGEVPPGSSSGPVLPVLPLVSAQTVTQPANGATDVNPTAPVRVTVGDGELDAVALTDSQGRAVSGQFAADRTSWTTTEPLGYANTYTWSGTATGIDRQPRAITGSFRTVMPERLISGQLNVATDGVYGIAMPIALTFDSKVIDRAAVQRALSVHTSVPTEGSWAWLDDTTVHWRPKSYFAPRTQVGVTAKLYGLAMGGGAFGSEDISATFTIGRSYVLRGDTRTHRLTAFADGVQVADYPASYGLDSDPGRVTHSGTHVVMRKYTVYYMSNPEYGYENLETRWAVRISNNGEFVHAAPWSVKQQGKANVSHGCVNLSPANAKEVYDVALPGDPVEIVGSSQQLGPSDGNYYDWTIPWEAWLAKSAL